MVVGVCSVYKCRSPVERTLSRNSGRGRIVSRFPPLCQDCFRSRLFLIYDFVFNNLYTAVIDLFLALFPLHPAFEAEAAAQRGSLGERGTIMASWALTTVRPSRASPAPPSFGSCFAKQKTHTLRKNIKKKTCSSHNHLLLYHTTS